MAAQAPPVEQAAAASVAPTPPDGADMAQYFAYQVALYRYRVAERRRRLAAQPPSRRISFAAPSPDTEEFWRQAAMGRALQQVLGPDLRTEDPAQDDQLRFLLVHRRALVALGREFLQLAEQGNAAAIQAFIEESFDVNYQDPLTGEAALHAAAGARARGVIRVLLAWGKCDFLLRDERGRLASELAYLFGRDPAAARLLGLKERRQAEASGITVTRRPARSL
jgi:hypothetical protein